VQYLHPKDGVYPEKVNAGRQGVNQNFRRIGDNVNPIKVGLAVCQQKQQLVITAGAALADSSGMQLGASSRFKGGKMAA
jgi:hypothetical protein